MADTSICYTTPMQDSIFTRIINREIPAHIIYETDAVIAFLNINPVQPGHTLVVPKAQIDRLEDLEEDDYVALMQTVRTLSHHIREELGTERICLKVEGFEVPHAHVHLIPCDTIEDFQSPPYEAGQDELDEMSERLTY